MTNEWDGTAWAGTPAQKRSWDPFGFAGSFNFGGMSYPLGLNQTAPGAKQEDIDGSFESLVGRAYKANGIIFAVMAARQRLFVQARFKYRRLTKGRPGALWSDQSLAILDHPWQGATTGDLLGRALQDADLAGNAYLVRRGGNRIVRLNPGWVSIVSDAPLENMDANLLGYAYKPGGRGSSEEAVLLLADEVAHFAPFADPMAKFRGMSWLSPIIREVMADSAARDHKLAFFENGATPNLVVTRGQEIDKDKFKDWVELMETGHTGFANAYKTLYLTAGSDATVIGANLRQLDFKITQGAGETRIAAAAGVPPIIVGLSEGLQAATYSNYGQARRAFADLWARPMWQNIAGSLATIVVPPSGSELFYDDRDIPFLAEDQKDRADIEHVKAQAIRSLVDGGFKADAVIAAVDAGDLSLLKGEHTGLFSVQLQAPGSTKMPQGEAPGETPVGDGTMPAMPMKAPNGTKPMMPEPPKRDEHLWERLLLTERRMDAAERRADVPPTITVHTPEVSVPVTFERGAFEVTNTVNTPEVNVTSPAVIVEPTPVTIEGVTVNVEPTPVTIETPAVTVEVAPTPVEIHNEVTVEPTPVSITVPEPRSVTKRVVRDEHNLITEIVETPDGE